MSLMIGTNLGQYQILAKLGEGGMGQVFRARDMRLGRDVALKILPEAFASDADRLTRFEREAKALASLNHPNIAHVYDTGRDGSVVYIAMELVDGEDLAAIIARGPIPIPEAVAIARQIAGGLEAAHEAGLIHRDLKPANVKIKGAWGPTPTRLPDGRLVPTHSASDIADGTVKVLDFGLAKALDTSLSSGSADAMMSPTMTSPATALGVILGTAAYMSPEQARGKPVDRRADVWAFGVVLFEMITGRKLFAREEVSDTLAAVLTHQPDLTALPASTPPSIRRLLARCLVKEKRQRLDSMSAVRLDLEDPESGAPAFVPSPAATARRYAILLLVFLLAGIAAGWALSKVWAGQADAAPAGAIVYAAIAPPEGFLSAFHEGFALSPDGETLAFTLRDRAGARQIWTRRLSSLDAQLLRGGEGGMQPMWSPDGGEIAFFVDGKLKRVVASGGPALTICDAPGLSQRGRGVRQASFCSRATTMGSPRCEK